MHRWVLVENWVHGSGMLGWRFESSRVVVSSWVKREVSLGVKLGAKG